MSHFLLLVNMATHGLDLIAVDTDLVFHPDSPRGVRCVNVTTLSDSIHEGTEVLGINLVRGDVTLSPHRAMLKIIDNNGIVLSLSLSSPLKTIFASLL